MKDVIDVCNHILKYSETYAFRLPPTLELQEEALDLCLIHGEKFVIMFIENYLKTITEEYV